MAPSPVNPLAAEQDAGVPLRDVLSVTRDTSWAQLLPARQSGQGDGFLQTLRFSVTQHAVRRCRATKERKLSYEIA